MLPRSIFVRCCQRLKSDKTRKFYDIRARNDTIFAPSTAVNPTKGCPLSVIRISGPLTKNVISQLTHYKAINGPVDPELTFEPRRMLRPRYATKTKFFSPNSKELIDIGLLLWFPAPASYTGEDVCEFHLHGSKSILTLILRVLGKFHGLRPAEPGEFTRRAVMNGKMTLLEAEGLSDLISSHTEMQRKIALKGLEGTTKRKYNSWIESLVNILAHLEAIIDFGDDYIIEQRDVLKLGISRLKSLNQELKKFIKTAIHYGRSIEGGSRAVILGKPNAGKSSLMNLISRTEKSIVSQMSGTTRDIVEHRLEIGGHVLTLSDTAGLKYSDCDLQNMNHHDSKNHEDIEKEGIRRAIEAARKSHLVIYVIDGREIEDGSRLMEDVVGELKEILDTLGPNYDRKTFHTVINKIDRGASESSNSFRGNLQFQLESNFGLTPSFISCKTSYNIDVLISLLSESLSKLVFDTQGLCDLDFVNERHLSLLQSAQEHLQGASELNNEDLDKIAQHVRESVEYLSRIVGSVSNDQVIDAIFKDFCIGK